MVSSAYYYSEAKLVQILDCTHLEIEVFSKDHIYGPERDQELDFANKKPVRMTVRLAGIIPIEGGIRNEQRCIAEIKQLSLGTFLGVWDMDSEDARLKDPAIAVRLFLKTGTEINEALIDRGAGGC